MPAWYVPRLAVLLAVVATGCASRQPLPSVAPAPAAALMGTATTPETVARAAFDQYVHAFWSEGDTAALLRGISPTMLYHDNGRLLPPDPQRHQDSMQGWREGFPDLTAVIDAYTGSGEYGAAATTWTGTVSRASGGSNVPLSL